MEGALASSLDAMAEAFASNLDFWDDALGCDLSLLLLLALLLLLLPPLLLSRASDEAGDASPLLLLLALTSLEFSVSLLTEGDETLVLRKSTSLRVKESESESESEEATAVWVHRSLRKKRKSVTAGEKSSGSSHQFVTLSSVLKARVSV